MNNELAKLKELAQRATLWPWKWFTSNSHNRLSSVPSGKDGDVISAFKAVDGAACVSVSHADMAFIEAAHPGAVIALIERLEAAEAQIKELTADLDKESEIRHRIHEELNAINGEQQPTGYIDSASLREYRGVKAGGSWSALPKTGEYNQTTPIYTHPAPEVLPVVELTDSTLVEVVRAWNRADYPADAYPAMREVLRAAGLEVKS